MRQSSHVLFIKINVPSERLFSYGRRDIMMLLHETVSAIENAALQLGYSKADDPHIINARLRSDPRNLPVMMGNDPAIHVFASL